MTRDEIMAANPILPLITAYGIPFKRSGSRVIISCPFHKENTPSCAVDEAKNVFHCFGCGQGGGVIDLVAKMENLSIGQAMRKMGGEFVPEARWEPLVVSTPPSEHQNAPTATQGSKEVAIYSYRDGLGTEVFQVIRYEPKTFRQRHMVDGQWIWSMEAVNRVLYNLPRILKSKSSNIFLVEGEKDADNLGKLGFIATCNVGGAGKWLDGYSETLRGKDVILCGDNDPTGEAHVGKVLEAIAKEAKTVRVVRIPPTHNGKKCKDVSDFIETFADAESAHNALLAMSDDATVLTGGIEVPVDTMEELEKQYSKSTVESETTQFDLSDWLPAFQGKVRPLLPGEVFLLMAATGVGKTSALANIAIAARNKLNVLMFELELPGPLTFEYYAALSTNTPASIVFDEYKAGRSVPWRESGKLNHITVCSRSGLSTDDIERIIIQTELKTGKRPQLVLIDYHQLLTGQGKSRYERASYSAEHLKIVAKKTKTIVVVSSQIKRKEDEDSPEVKLSDGKESGSLENSSGLVAGMWKDPHDVNLMHIKILKGTKGGTGTRVECDFDGRTRSITQRSLIPVEAVPPVEPKKPFWKTNPAGPDGSLPYADE